MLLSQRVHASGSERVRPSMGGEGGEGGRPVSFRGVSDVRPSRPSLCPPATSWSTSDQSISDPGPQITALPQINARWSADHCTHKGSMLAPQSLNPNICGQASRSGWMGEAKKRIVGDRKRAESPTEGHNTLLFCVARSVFAAIPTYLPAIGLCKGGTWGDQQSAQGGSLHTPTTDHSTQLITASP